MLRLVYHKTSLTAISAGYIVSQFHYQPVPLSASYIVRRKKIIEGCPHPQFPLLRHMGIIFGRNSDAAVPQPLGYSIHCFPCLQQHGGVGMAQGMGRASPKIFLAPGVKKTKIRRTYLLAALNPAADIIPLVVPAVSHRLPHIHLAQLLRLQKQMQLCAIKFQYTNSNCFTNIHKLCYNKHAAHLPSPREGGVKMETFGTFLLSVVAGVVSHYICKWLDG